jgi:hypothetical protein
MRRRQAARRCVRGRDHAHWGLSDHRSRAGATSAAAPPCHEVHADLSAWCSMSTTHGQEKPVWTGSWQLHAAAAPHRRAMALAVRSRRHGPAAAVSQRSPAVTRPVAARNSRLPCRSAVVDSAPPAGSAAREDRGAHPVGHPRANLTDLRPPPGLLPCCSCLLSQPGRWRPKCCVWGPAWGALQSDSLTHGAGGVGGPAAGRGLGPLAGPHAGHAAGGGQVEGGGAAVGTARR